MNEDQEDSADFQSSSREETEQPSGQSVLSGGTQEEVKSTQGKVGHSDDEYNTDLEEDISTSSQRSSLSPSELYLKACRQTGVVPVSYILRHFGDPTLNLNYYGLGPRGAKALAILLKSHSVVTHLELKKNALQAEGAQYLLEMLRTNRRIQSLNLSSNMLGLKGATVISKMLSDKFYIKSINLSGNDFDDSAAKCLAEALKTDNAVKELDVSHNHFCNAGDLGVMLEKESVPYSIDSQSGCCSLLVVCGGTAANNISIEVLNLSWNGLRMPGAVALFAGLKVNSTLKELQLSHNGFGRTEAQSLARALKLNHTLVLLDLSGNRVDDEALKVLCQGLATNETLEVLKLSYNPITKVGALTLLRTVKNNMKSALKDIDVFVSGAFESVLVCEGFVELLEEILRTRPALCVQYSAVASVTTNLAAPRIFKKFLEEQNKSVMDFFQALDKEGTMKVSTSAFRNAVKEAKIPLSQQQLEWLIRKLNKNCTATIVYSQSAELSEMWNY